MRIRLYYVGIYLPITPNIPRYALDTKRDYKLCTYLSTSMEIIMSSNFKNQ